MVDTEQKSLGTQEEVSSSRYNHLKIPGSKRFQDWEKHLNKALKESNSCRVGK